MKRVIDILKVQGINGVRVRQVIADTGQADGFLVKNWIFFAPFHSPPNAVFPYRVKSLPPFAEGVFRGIGINGQGPNSQPCARFVNHALVQVGLVLYDPSYGVSYAENAWEPTFKSFLDGFVKVINILWAVESMAFPLILDELQ